ncbi:MAG: hypothetical protein KAS12_04080 [Candidatus Aenigmarchaeota archaeon]|nr:hypothetical protein [Candidatus Aenigmarchaeota archaeon]
MGGTQSSSISKSTTVNDIISSIITNNVSESSTGSYQTQTIAVRNSSYTVISGVNMVQVAMLKSEATQSNSAMNKLQNEIVSTLQAKLEAETKGIIGDSSKAELDNYVKTQVKNSVTTNNVQKCILASHQRQEIIVERASSTIIENVSMKQTLEAFQKCVAANDNIAQASTNIANKVDVALSAKTENVSGNILTDLVSSLTSMFTTPLILLFVLVFIIIIATVYLLSGNSDPQHYDAYEL